MGAHEARVADESTGHDVEPPTPGSIRTRRIHLVGAGGSGMSAKRRVHWAQKVEAVAPHACRTERRAEDAERAMQQAALIRFLSPRLGDEMSGSIISLYSFGFFVRLDDS